MDPPPSDERSTAFWVKLESVMSPAVLWSARAPPGSRRGGVITSSMNQGEDQDCGTGAGDVLGVRIIA